MKWRSLIIPAILILLTCIFVIAAKTFQKVRAKKLAMEKMAYFPVIRLVATDSITFKISPNNEPALLIFFNPDCDHCQNEAKDFQNHREDLSDAYIVWVSSNNLYFIRKFSEEFGLAGISNIHFAKIEPDKVFETFGSLSIPHIFVYSKEQKLIKEFKGEVKVEAILPFLK